MSEMIERVAIAQAGTRWDSFDEEHKNAARDLARIAIEAMREPTEAMVKDGSSFVWFEGRTFEYEDVTTTYQAMIDAALR